MEEWAVCRSPAKLLSIRTGTCSSDGYAKRRLARRRFSEGKKLAIAGAIISQGAWRSRVQLLATLSIL
jgi:hypothetical protein